MRPGVITVLLLSIVATWNNFFLPLIMLSTSKLYPLTVGIGLWQTLAASNNSGGQSLWSLIIVGSLVSIVPLIVAFLTLQKYWQGGLAVGSLK
jgi:multiple sugar transport system permease protein